ncbi:MAG: hypothetical protein FWD36_03825, partial [Treponema sp.]|nr:hypothetical protein [Treponema sp.]
MKNTYITAIIGIVFLFSSIGCRNDETELTNQSVRSIQFTEEKIRLKAGEQVTVRLNIDPAEAKNNTTVQYRASTNGYIDISNASNDGCIIKALKGGSVILIAESGKYTAYLEIEIDMQESVPYIIIPMQVIELNEGAMKSVQVSLYNGSALDNHAFEWTTETGKDNISIFATANTVVVKGEKRGSQKIIVRHEKTQFEGEILIFVIGVDEVPRYITSASNVLVMETGGVNRQFNVSLVNGKETDKAGFTFNVIEGDGVVNILTSNETCNVLPVKNGTALIRARHPLAEYPLDIRVIVVLGNEPVISLDKTFLLMNNNSTDFITARIEGNHQVQWLNDFEYTLSDSDVIDITKTNNSLFITAKKPGSCVIAIRNRHITYSREALIIVRSEKEIVPDDYYITTSQNVLQLEVGQKLPTQLTMQLVGGIEADKNLFTWVVDDGTIIDVESAYGTVQYARGIIARSIITDVFSAAAIITPKKTGLAKITLIHPKSSVTASVIVKVYPRGTFSGVPFILGNNEGGLIRVDTTKADKRVVLHMVSGNETELGPLVWEIENTNIASVSALTGLENEIHGITRGTTKLIVNNNNLKYPYEALVMAGTTEELARMNVLYTDNVYQTVAVGQSISVQIKDSSDLLSQDFNFSVSVQGANTVNAVMIKSRLLLQGMDEGSARVVISHPQAENTVTIYVQTEPGAISIDKPYTITGPSFVGMYYGQKLDSSVQMNGAAPIELDRIKWHSQDNSIVSVTGNGPMAKIEAGTTTGQTNITVTHTKSMNEKNIVYYVVPTAADLASSVVLGIAKENWLVKTGDELLLKLVTNATDDQKKGIVWGGFDISVVHVDFNGDSAFVRATGEGNTAITVHHPQNVIPLKIYISVGNIPPETKSISLPSIIEMIIGENKIIKADTTGLTINEKAAIQWSIEDDSIAAISNDGEQSFILGKKKGQTYINVTQTAIGFQKRILLVCAASYEELQNTYVMAAPETFYRLKTGEQRNITLLFGQAGFPEAEKQNITWKEGGNNVLALYPNGDKLQFEGKNEGISKITATHPLAFSSVVITVEVYKETIPGIDYRFEYEAMKGMVVGSSAVITIMLTPNGAINGQLTFENENDSTASVIQTGAGNEFYVTALQKGQTYLTVRHPLALDPARILIYTANTEAELQMMFPISLAKPNYLLTIGGKSETIKIETPNDDPAKLALISWSPDDTSIVDYTIKSKKEIEITGKKEGNCTFSIRYNNVVVEKAYISVKAAGNIDFSKRIATESIIGIMRGEKRQTIIAHNLTGNEAALLEWETHNPAVARVMPIAGDRSKAEIEAIGSGETEIVVSLGQIKRYIKVYVCDTETEIMAYKALNIDCRYYQIRRNDEITLTAYHAAANTASSDTWIHSPYDANVVSITANGKNKAQIKGINEGIAAILLENIECATPVMIMVEVSNTAPSVTENTDGWFLTTSKTVYALDPQKTTELTRITVTPVKFNEAEIPKIKWQIISGSNLISMYSNGGVFCDVAPNGGSGTAVIRAEHPKSANYIDITIICSVDPIPDDGTPFITSSEEVVRLANGSEKQ